MRRCNMRRTGHAAQRNATQRPSGSGERADVRPATSRARKAHIRRATLPQVFETPEVVRVYVGSFWAAPLKNSENSALFAKVAVGAAPSNASLVGSPLAAEGPTGRPTGLRHRWRCHRWPPRRICSACRTCTMQRHAPHEMQHATYDLRHATYNDMQRPGQRAARAVLSGTRRHLLTLVGYNSGRPTTAVLTLPRHRGTL